MALLPRAALPAHQRSCEHAEVFRTGARSPSLGPADDRPPRRGVPRARARTKTPNASSSGRASSIHVPQRPSRASAAWLERAVIRRAPWSTWSRHWRSTRSDARALPAGAELSKPWPTREGRGASREAWRRPASALRSADAGLLLAGRQRRRALQPRCARYAGAEVGRGGRSLSQGAGARSDKRAARIQPGPGALLEGRP